MTGIVDNRATPKRPTSSAIAASPLEQLPFRCVEEAKQLLNKGEAVLDAWLGNDRVQAAMWHQGVNAEDIISITSKGRIEELCASKLRFVHQLLAQIIWEEKLCAAEVSFGGPLSSSIRAARPTTPKVCEPTSSGTSSHGAFILTVQDQGVDQKEPQSNLAQTPRSERRRSMQDHCLNAFDEKLCDRVQRWNNQEQALLEAREARMRRMRGLRERLRTKNKQKEARSAAHAQDREKQRQDKQQALQELDRQLQQRVAKSKLIHRSTADAISSVSSARYNALEAKRRILEEEEQERQRAKLESLDAAQEEACARRQDQLRVKSAGPPALRAVREVVRRQAARVQRIREVEREALEQQLANVHRAPQLPHAGRICTPVASTVLRRLSTAICQRQPGSSVPAQPSTDAPNALRPCPQSCPQSSRPVVKRREEPPCEEP